MSKGGFRAMGLQWRILVLATAPVLVCVLTLLALDRISGGAVVEGMVAGGVAGILLAVRFWFGLRDSLARMLVSARRMAGESQGESVGGGEELADLPRIASWMGQLSEEVREALRAAREREQETEAVFAQMADGILLVDRDLRIRRVNPAAADILAIQPHRAVGYTVIEATMLHALDELFREALASGETRMRRLETIQPRRRLLQVLVTPLEEGPSVSGAVAVLQDLTEFDRVERVRRDFVTNVSHELRTPVTSIKVMVESLQRGAIKDKNLREQFFQSIVESADRLARLVDDVLTLARVEAGPGRMEWRAVALDEVVREAVNALSPLARECDVELVANEVEPITLKGDAEGLRQAVANLVANGVKYNRPGGHVRICLRREGNEAVLEVIDTGIGIAADQVPRIFERFYRVDRGRSRELGGTGLGLAIVKHVCEAHGGQIQVESTVGEGSTFRLLLPLETDVPAVTASASESS